MKSYLVQRGTFEDKVDISTIEGLDSIVHFDYMGSSEFEWGSLPKSLRRCISAFKKDQFKYHPITINGKAFHLYGANLSEDDATYVKDFMENKIINPYGGTKEMVYIHSYFEGKYKVQLKKGCSKKTEKVSNYGYCDFWWDIDNDWMLFPEEPLFKRKFDIAIKKLLDRDFTTEAKMKERG